MVVEDDVYASNSILCQDRWHNCRPDARVEDSEDLAVMQRGNSEEDEGYSDEDEGWEGVAHGHCCSFQFHALGECGTLVEL